MIPTFMIKPVFARLLIHVPVKSRDERPFADRAVDACSKNAGDR
jgi:hypothetical protein